MENKATVKAILDMIVSSNLKISEKLHLINSFSPMDEDEAKQTRMDMLINYRYCACCNEWYLAESWQHTQTTGKRTVRTFLDSVAEDDLYVEKYCDILIDTCPVGHQFETILRKKPL